jgi:hypothetical protein
MRSKAEQGHGVSSKPFIERRKYPRIEKNVPLKLSWADADVVTETRNISCAGAYCRVSKYVEPMTRVEITLLLPLKKGQKITTRKITCRGVVVRTEGIPGSEDFYTAIFFSDILPKDSRTLAQFVEASLAAKAASLN